MGSALLGRTHGIAALGIMQCGAFVQLACIDHALMEERVHWAVEENTIDIDV